MSTIYPPKALFGGEERALGAAGNTGTAAPAWFCIPYLLKISASSRRVREVINLVMPWLKVLSSLEGFASVCSGEPGVEKEPERVKATRKNLASNWCSVTAKSVLLRLQLVLVMENTGEEMFVHGRGWVWEKVVLGCLKTGINPPTFTCTA